MLYIYYIFNWVFHKNWQHCYRVEGPIKKHHHIVLSCMKNTTWCVYTWKSHTGEKRKSIQWKVISVIKEQKGAEEDVKNCRNFDSWIRRNCDQLGDWYYTITKRKLKPGKTWRTVMLHVILCNVKNINLRKKGIFMLLGDLTLDETMNQLN